MRSFVDWCNYNSGFVSAVLSIATILVSIIAIVISILTARLPYKKKAKLSGSISYAFPAERPTVAAYDVNATNIGNRNINITFLGLAIKTALRSKKNLAALHLVGATQYYKGIIKPSEIMTATYPAEKLINSLRSYKGQRKILYYYVMDSEGDIRIKRFVSVDALLRQFGF